MKKNIYIILLILLTLSACDKAFVNGDLDGMWRLEKVTHEGVEIFPDGIYYSFQRHLVSLGQYYEEGNPFLYMAKFSREGNVLKMNTFKEYPGIDDVCDEAVLAGFHIYDKNGVEFTIDCLDEDVLVMHTADRVYNFRKW